MYMSHERGRKGSHHRFITEKRVFENWARTFNIHFFQPDWKPEPLTVNHPEIKPVVWRAKAQDHNHSHLLYQPSGYWTFWNSKATSGRRVPGFAVYHCNNRKLWWRSRAYQKYFLLSCVLIQYIAFFGHLTSCMCMWFVINNLSIINGWLLHYGFLKYNATEFS